ncbi:MAG: hypothetical protein IJO65_08430 [Lachnospiraceae bacterium]|nr:hypothetical protein [Lachnospiraceae bacterium]MBQ9927992.1 hypothetical protein [Lachnospiraceae bacterium]
MTHEEKKLGKIVEELTMFFFAVGADKIHSGIEKKEKHVVIDFEANYNPAYSENLGRLDHYLNGEKTEGMEDIYWELAGSGDPGETSQLLLVGMMVDKAEVTVGETDVKLRLYKELL